ncbi:MAG: hypothetical protein KY432_11895 [Acidobacteria bacterium]|nr:hypothetical protein [Acidobacteriota bacterium]
MRDEMLAAVIRRAMEHDEFRQGLVDEPRQTLQNHGFALEEPEFKEIEKIGSELGSDNSREALEKIADRYGVEPQKT